MKVTGRNHSAYIRTHVLCAVSLISVLAVLSGLHQLPLSCQGPFSNCGVRHRRSSPKVRECLVSKSLWTIQCPTWSGDSELLQHIAGKDSHPASTSRLVSLRSCVLFLRSRFPHWPASCPSRAHMPIANPARGTFALSTASTSNARAIDARRERDTDSQRLYRLRGNYGSIGEKDSGSVSRRTRARL